jgi:ribonuclease T2
VHGLWPQRRDGTWPEFCDSSSELDVDEIEDLLPELEKAWPSWSSDDETFWGHEWTRHGTCAEGIVGRQHAFFQTVLRLHNKLNIQVCKQHREQQDHCRM